MLKVLVTGGAGFIGSHLVEHFQGQAEVRVLDNLRSGYLHNLKGFKVELIQGSILDRQQVREAVRGIDLVFHLAALVSVPESMDNPLECLHINAEGLLNVLEASSEAGVRKLVFSSSAAIYGDNPVVPKVETMCPEPKSPYALTKLDGEYYCRLFSDRGRLETACLRYFNVFGPRQDPRSTYAAAVPIFVDRAVRNAPLVIYGDGEQTRDFIYVKDVVAANVFAATSPGMTGVFNVAYGKRLSVNDLARRILALTGSNSPIVYQPERPGDVKHSQADPSRIFQAGFQPTGDFDRGLSATIDFFKQ